MKKKRLEQLEKNIKEVGKQYKPLMDLFSMWQKAEDEQTAREIREEAEKWLKKDGQFTRPAFFPPNDADVSGIVSLVEWHNFARYKSAKV